MISKFLKLFFLVMSINNISYGQKFIDTTIHRIETNKSSWKYIQNEMNEYYRNNPDASGEKQWRRKEWFLEPRMYGDYTITEMYNTVEEEYSSLLRRLPKSRSTHGSWSFIGPESTQTKMKQGRVNRIDFHPSDPNTLYVSTPNGGLWESTNDGGSWNIISPNLPNLSIADIEIDHTNPNIIYALAGDGNPGNLFQIGHLQLGENSNNIYKTTNRGQSWTKMTYTTPPSGTHKLIMHPLNPLVQFALTQTGIYRTTDGWELPENRTNVLPGSTYWDLEFHPSNFQIVYASGPFKLKKSTNGGVSWDDMTDPNVLIIDDCQRMEIAVSPADPSSVFVLGGCFRGSRLFYSDNEGNAGSWEVKDSTFELIGGQFTYNIGLGVSPSDINIVYAGGIGSFISSTGGTPPWRLLRGVHTDIHDVQFRNGSVYAATDGGIHATNIGNYLFTDISDGLGITEIYRISGTPLDPEKYIIGSQDNGHHMRESNSTTFRNFSGADGMVSLIDHNNPNIIYYSGQYGGIHRSVDNGITSDGINPAGDAGAWVTPFIMDHLNPNILFLGKDSIHRTSNGGTNWDYIGSPTSQNLNVMAQAHNDREILFVSSKENLFRTANAFVFPGQATWESLNVPHSKFISDIIVHPLNDNIIFITYGSILTFGAPCQIYRGTYANGTMTWENYSGGLPRVPVSAVVYDRNSSNTNALYVGTDIGVFYNDDSLSDWIYYSNNMPAVLVTDLYINPTNNTISAGTYGRGLWRSPLYSSCVQNINLTNSLIPNKGLYHYSSSISIRSNISYGQDLGTEIHYKAGDYVDLLDGFYFGPNQFFEAKTGPCPD